MLPRTPHKTIPHKERILVVDDNAEAAEGLAVLLAHRGHLTRIAYGGLAALRVAESFRPCIVLLDIGMQDLNGYEVARRLRNMPYPPELIIAVSGYGMSHDKDKAAAAGFSHYLVKPVKIAEVIALIEGGAPLSAAADRRESSRNPAAS